jgi:hypothetical protein
MNILVNRLETVSRDFRPLVIFHQTIRIARDKMAERWINWSNFGPLLYDLKEQSIKKLFIGDLAIFLT